MVFGDPSDRVFQPPCRSPDPQVEQPCVSGPPAKACQVQGEETSFHLQTGKSKVLDEPLGWEIILGPLWKILILRVKHVSKALFLCVWQVCMCVRVCMFMCVCVSVCIMNVCHMCDVLKIKRGHWVLRTKLRASERAGGALSHRASSWAPTAMLTFNGIITQSIHLFKNLVILW